MLVTIIPADLWHDCDHQHAHEEEASGAQLLEDHQCEICDFHFSGYHFELPEADINGVSIVSAQISLYRFIDGETPAGISASRAPPGLV